MRIHFSLVGLALCGAAWLSLACAPLDDGGSSQELNTFARATLALGEQVRELELPEGEVLCPTSPPDDPISHVAISVAAIPGHIAAPDRPDLANRALLATSCRNGAFPSIYLVDPDDPLPNGEAEPPVTSPEVVREIVPTEDGVTPFAPFYGWGSLSFRGDRSPPDLLACANPDASGTPHSVYKIDIETGRATFLFEGAPITPGLPFCDGMAWDPYNDTVWMSSDISDTIYRFRATNSTETVWVEVPAPDSVANSAVGSDGVRRFTVNHLELNGQHCYSDGLGAEARSGNSGIEVVGSNLLLACNGKEQMHLVQQSDFEVVPGGSFTTAAGRAEDLACDRWTFGYADIPIDQQKSVVWTKDAFDRELFAVEVPENTCGHCRPAERLALHELTAEERSNLAELIEEYLTGQIVGVHSSISALWHSTPNFFPAHRGYIGGLEIWLFNVVRNRPGETRYSDKFFPLPKWDPGEPFPDRDVLADNENPFLRVDTDACVASGTACPENCDTFESNPPQVALPPQFRSPQQSGVDPGTMCDDFANVEAVRTGGFESGWHGSQVHCGFPRRADHPLTFANPGCSSFPGARSTMCDVNISPSALIFWPWHAFVDDVARDFECNCGDASGPACAICTDVFQPFLPPSSVAPFLIPGAAPAEPPPEHWSSPIGFWWWFEDFVMPPAVSPEVTIDHSGLAFEGRVLGGASLAVGKVGQAIELDGKNDFVEVLDKTVGEVGSSDFSIDAWVKTSSRKHQGIVDKRNHKGAGFALFIDDGQLGLELGTQDAQESFVTETVDLADGEWHHVAAVVTRSRVEGSGLFVDGQLVTLFDVTELAGNIVANTRLWLGRARLQDGRHGSLGHHPHGRHSHVRHFPFRPHRDGHGSHHGHRPRGKHGSPHHLGHRRGYFEGQLDEVSLVRHALSADLVAAIYAADRAGKFTSLGALPTSVEQPPCLEQLESAIDSLPEASALLGDLFDQVLAALAAGNRSVARMRLEELSELAHERALSAGWEGGDIVFHPIHFIAHECSEIPPVSRERRRQR